jgi:hypothetical protein
MLQNLKNGGKMNNKKVFQIWIIACIVIFISGTFLQAQQNEGCFDAKGNPVRCGDGWDVEYNGVKYHCNCDCPNPPNCVPISSSSSSNSNSGSGNFNEQMVQSVVAPLIQNFFNWVFSSSSDNNEETNRAAENEKYEEEAAEYNRKVQEQVSNAYNDYSKLMEQKFKDEKQSAVSDIKNKIAKSEAVKSIKQLNCAAYQSLQAAKMIIHNNIDFNDLNGPLENSRKLADFTANDTSGCPEIKINVPEVTASNPVGFQQLIFETIKYKADSLAVNLALLKQNDKKIKSDIVEKEKVVEQLKNSKPSKDSTDDQIMKDALAALNEAQDEDKKVTEELNESEKDIKQLEKARSVYDINKP